MKTNLKDSIWKKQNCTIQDETIIVEAVKAGQPHAVHMELKTEITTGTKQAVLQAIIRPHQRTLCWVGARANNKFFMATFDLAAGAALGKGTNVSNHEILDRGDGSFECRVLFDGTFPIDNPVFAIGAAVEDQEEDYTGQDGLLAIEVLHHHFAEGTEFLETLGEEVIEETADALHFVRTGSTPLVLAGAEYETDAFSASSAVAWNGKPGEINLLQHWSETDNERGWRLFVNESGQPSVELSSDGSTIIKRYESKVILQENNLCLISFTWNGKELSFYLNDIKLTPEQFKAITDLDFEGKVHNSNAAVEAVKSGNGTPFTHWLWADLRTSDEIIEAAKQLNLTGLPGILVDEPGPTPITIAPTGLDDVIQWLSDKEGVLEDNIRYVDNLDGNDGNDGESVDTPWRTIQKAADELTAGMAVIIRGKGGRFFEQVTPQKSGTEGQRIWFVGDPDHPPILDSSEVFDVSWSNMGSNRWRAPYNKNRKFSKELAYHNNCTTGSCRHESVWISHQLIFDDKQLIRRSQASVPAELNEGECFFEKGSGSYDQPEFVWCRLPGNADPNQTEMRIASDKKYLFDWSPHTWETFPGGDGAVKAEGRNHIGLYNLHFRFGAQIRKLAPLNIRGTGWHVEHCSVSEGNAYGFSISGNNHTIIDSKFINSGQGVFRGDHHQKTEGTTRIERCLFDGGNLHKYPEAWEAGQKFTNSGIEGSTEIVECMFVNIHGPALWWDIFNGKKGKATPSYLIQRCIFERCARNAIFFEHNSYNITVEHCGIWNTLESTEGQFSQTLAAAFRSQAAGHNTVRNTAIVFNEGKGMYFKAHDLRGENNNDTIVDNVFVNNARNGNVDMEQCEFYGGDQPNGPEWSTSTIQGNVFSSADLANLFVRDNNGTRTRTSDISTFESAAWTGGSGNSKIGNAKDVISNPEDRKAFWKTIGAFAGKGPQNLVHYEDLPDTGWSIPE